MVAVRWVSILTYIVIEILTMVDSEVGIRINKGHWIRVGRIPIYLPGSQRDKRD
jgi:hypothetical protein